MASKDKAGERPLTARHQRFVEEYLADLNGTKAAIRAGFAERGAHVTASRLLKNPKIQAAITEAKRKRTERTEITADQVVDGLLREAKAGAPSDFNEADPNAARIRAWELLGRHVGMFVEKHKHEHSGDVGPRHVTITLVKPDGTEETETRKDGKGG